MISLLVLAAFPQAQPDIAAARRSEVARTVLVATATPSVCSVMPVNSAGDEVRLKFRNEGAEPQDVSLRLTAVPKADMTATEEDKGNTPMENDQ